MSDDALKLMALQARAGLLRDGLKGHALSLALAVVSQAVHRERGWWPRSTQIEAAAWMLHNHLVEVGTGEGKTLVAQLVGATAALAGVPVHVLTSNDYLAQRDADEARALCARLGLSVGCIQHDDAADTRRMAYACDLTYASAREVVFDHLRDRLGACDEGRDSPAAHDRPVLRGLCMAVLDEADSLLIDEASTPLILSQQVRDDELPRWRLALFLARQMKPGEQVVETAPGRWQLTEAGREWLVQRARTLGTEWQLRRLREEWVTQALTALHAFQRDVDYVVHDDEIQIVDVHSGRRAQGRSWSRGLHQLIGLKEGLQPAPSTQTLLQMTSQQFFPRYLRLCGQSGTLSEARAELLATYGLPVRPVAPHRPSQRRDLGLCVHAQADEHWQAVADRVMARHAKGQGQPVLVGTRSVADSMRLSALLKARGCPHRVLNASQDQAESDVVARAGEPGAVTVATQMAGRGTDVHVGEAAEALGGLHVIVAGLHPARRIDRQLAGRCARRGQPGTHERLIHLEDEGWWPWAPAGLRKALGAWLSRWPRLSAPLCCLAVRWAQGRHEAAASQARWVLLQQEEQLASQLSWRGRHPWDQT
jgi:preprotein translocase subunit SecA